MKKIKIIVILVGLCLIEIQSIASKEEQNNNINNSLVALLNVSELEDEDRNRNENLSNSSCKENINTREHNSGPRDS